MALTQLPWSVSELLPHSGEMIVIDDVLAVGADWVESGVRIGEDSLLYEPGAGVPVWTGIEYISKYQTTIDFHVIFYIYIDVGPGSTPIIAPV